MENDASFSLEGLGLVTHPASFAALGVSGCWLAIKPRREYRGSHFSCFEAQREQGTCLLQAVFVFAQLTQAMAVRFVVVGLSSMDSEFESSGIS